MAIFDAFKDITSSSSSSSSEATAQITALKQRIDELVTKLSLAEQHAAAYAQRFEAVAKRLITSEAQRDDYLGANRRLLAVSTRQEDLLQHQRKETDRFKALVREKDSGLQDSRATVLELKEALAHRTEELNELKEDRATQPLTDYALLAAYTNQRSILDALANTLCCPLCFEPFAKNEVVSLACSHTFCSPCIERWASASVQTQLQIPVELARGQVRPECPECRGDASKSGRVRVIMLEEAIRVLQRYDPLEIMPSSMSKGMEMQVDDVEAVMLLKPRERATYVGKAEVRAPIVTEEREENEVMD